MPQSLSNILIHLIWSTKDRHPWLTTGICEKTHAFLAGAVRQMDCEAYRVGGVADHVHLAVRLSRTFSVADLVKEIKTASSKWAAKKPPFDAIVANARPHASRSSPTDTSVRYWQGWG